jgi:hypothetical protein
VLLLVRIVLVPPPFVLSEESSSWCWACCNHHPNKTEIKGKMLKNNKEIMM